MTCLDVRNGKRLLNRAREFRAPCRIPREWKALPSTGDRSMMTVGERLFLRW